ncbi:MAG: PAS domain S-box protein [Lacunisphaera sp.]|nr:PAS domain S-box protein [Lacunisphaera sp.]
MLAESNPAPALVASELRFRRLFEAAHDGILLVDPGTRKIIDVNPFLVQLTGYAYWDFIGRELFEIGLLKDEAASQDAFQELQVTGQIRYDDLPLLTKDGRSVAVEFVSNLYQEGEQQVIQCNIRDISARKRMEEELRWKTAFLEAQVNSSLDGILVVDQREKKLLQNSRLDDLFKIPPDIRHGSDDARQIQWVSGMTKDPVRFAAKVAQLYAHADEISRDEVELTDGTILDRYSAPMVGQDGYRYGRIWTFRDITAQRWVARELREARVAAAVREGAQRYHFLADTVPLIIWTARPDGRTDYFNKAWFDYTGLTLAPTKDWGWDAVVHPEDLPRCVERWTHSCTTGEDYEIEYRFKRAGDGIYRWFLGRATSRRDEAGAIVQWVGTCTDIDDQKRAHALLETRVRERTRELSRAVEDLQAENTERKEAEEALRESNVKFHQLADNISDAFWIRSPDLSEVQYVSPAFERIWGRPAGTLYANPHQWTDYIFPEDRARVHGAFAALTGDTPSLDLEYRIVRPGGEVRWVHVRGFQIRDATDRLIRHAGIVTDITERRRLDEHFLQAQKMEALGQFSGGVAHDFNNILATITGYTELSRLTLEGNPAVRRHLDVVLVAAQRAADLVRQILTFSRQETQEREVIDLLPVVAESLKLMRAAIPATIEFGALVAVDAPTVLANANQIHQILMNLGVNAWHAMKDRPGRLNVKLERCVVDAAMAARQPRLRPGTYARVSFSDTGAGMDPATLGRIFEPFFTTKQPGAGTGLGLAVVHGIMESHDGAVVVSSTPGQGTEFQLYFPAHSGAARLTPRPKVSVPRGQGERILVVDDERSVAETVQLILETLGYAVELANLAETAIAMVRTNPLRYALVLTDQTMAGMTGTTLAGQLQLIQPGLPIILMTGYSAVLTPEKVRALGIRQLLLKPASYEAIGTAVHAALAPLRPGTAPAAA